MMDTWATVLVRMPPWIGPQHFYIRAVPFFFFPRGGFQERLQALFRSWVPVEVDVKPLQGRLQFGHVGFSRADLGLLGCADELWDDRGGQDAEDDDHDHDFN